MPDAAAIESATDVRHSANSVRHRVAAILEVILAFVLVHLAWRSLKHFTWLGQVEGRAHQNYTAGLMMIAFAIIAIKLHGRSLAEFGLNLRDWRSNLNLGIIWGVVAPVTLGIALWLSGFRPRNYVRPGTPWSLAVAGNILALGYTLILLWTLRRRGSWLGRVPLFVSVEALLLLWSAPILSAACSHRSVGYMAGTVGWMVLGAGFGEEIFFRGYIQTRLDSAFGRPLLLWGTGFGVGLLVSSLLFGLVHALNTVDYFTGHFQFDWPSGLFNCFTGVFYAAMRERTGSVFPGAIAHGISDVLTRIAG